MLLEYGTSNFLSFRDEAYLDLHPAKNKAINRYPNNYATLENGEKVLKTSVIVGENAGGKSNFVTSLIFLKDLLSRSNQPAKSYWNTLNSANIASDENGDRGLSISNTTQEFSISVALGVSTLKFDLELDYTGICSESLSVQHGKSRAFRQVYDVKRGETVWRGEDAGEGGESEKFIEYSISYDPEVGSLSDELVESGRDANFGPKRLTVVWLAAIGEVNCRAFIDALTKDVLIARLADNRFGRDAIDLDSVTSVMALPSYLNIVRLIDSSIVSIVVDNDQPMEQSLIVRRDTNGREYSRQVREDSAGVRQFLYWAYYIYQVVYENKTVFADEIDSAINPVLSDRVLAYINGKDHRGQFIFTTHNIFNLTLRTNMKEQINFVTKDPMTLSSSMYSLADFTDIRYDVKEELYEFYLKGALGGTVHA